MIVGLEVVKRPWHRYLQRVIDNSGCSLVISAATLLHRDIDTRSVGYEYLEKGGGVLRWYGLDVKFDDFCALVREVRPKVCIVAPIHNAVTWEQIYVDRLSDLAFFVDENIVVPSDRAEVVAALGPRFTPALLQPFLDSMWVFNNKRAWIMNDSHLGLWHSFCELHAIGAIVEGVVLEHKAWAGTPSRCWVQPFDPYLDAVKASDKRAALEQTLSNLHNYWDSVADAYYS